MESEFYKELVKRYLEKKLGEEELEVFFHLLGEGKLDVYLRETMDAAIEEKEREAVAVVPPKRPAYHYLYRAAAAVVILTLGTLLFRYYTRPVPVEPVQMAKKAAPVVPGGNNALLTLGDGKQIILNQAPDGLLEQGASFSVRKEKDGLVVFDVNEAAAGEPQGINKIETPKGGIYQVVLPDGSLVWLNNASSISFPTRFRERERRVTISGEVYFEVKHDPSKPFRVVSDRQEVEVLGTKFNVNAYKDESAIKTTLLEGSVKIHTAQRSGLLKPGFQAVLRPEQIAIRRADVEAVMAWKEGFFQFDRADIQTLMRQLARWYNIEIKYTGSIPKDEFVGKIKRSEDIRNVLEILRYGKVKFRLEGRTLIVE